MNPFQLRYRQKRGLSFEFLETRNLLATITVDQIVDSSGTNNDVSLREAIEAANTDTSIDGSTAGNGPDTIVFDASLSGKTINLSSEYVITRPLTIDASNLAKGITINANQNSRVFNFTAGVGNLTLKGLNITGGLTTADNGFGDTSNSGGGIRFMSSGTLTIDKSAIYDNRTEGIRAGGGGIFTDSGAVVLNESTLSGNRTSGGGAEGGGLHTTSGTVTIENSTVTKNRTTGFNSDGGGIFVSNTANNPAFTISNSIVADNSVSANSLLPDLFPDPNVTLDINHSLIGDTTGTGITPVTGLGNLLNVDSQLEALADNGGLSMTHAPLHTSPAVNAGDPNFSVGSDPYDQRGFPFVRTFDSHIDMGALETQQLVLVVSTDTDESDGDLSTGNLSLREAVDLTSLSPNLDPTTFDVIEFGSSLTGATILLNEELLVTDSLTIDGSSHVTPVTIDGQHATRLFNFVEPDGSTSTHDFNLIGMSLTRGRTTDLDLPISIPAGGAGVRFVSTGTLSLIDTTITDSQVKGPSFDGGAITTESGTISLVRSELTGNQTDGTASRGGAIATTYGDITLTDSTVSDNLISGGTYHGAGGGL
ncbi:MAG: right-handed parallel beta-helix repeat-containing protein, partial [Planctomycetota bacterium]